MKTGMGPRDKRRGAVVPQDAENHPGNGRIYVCEMFAGEAIETDINPNTSRHLKVPADDTLPGGVFAKMGMPTPSAWPRRTPFAGRETGLLVLPDRLIGPAGHCA